MMDINDWKNGRIKITGTYFLKAGAGYRMIDYKYRVLQKNVYTL
jgi:hypothetical protein